MKVPPDNDINRLLEEMPKLSPMMAQIALSEAYDIAYGIFNHDAAPDRPLSIIAHHPSEDVVTNGPLRQRIYRFIKFDISDRCGLSLMEFLALPRDHVEMIMKITQDIIQKEMEVQENATSTTKK